MGTTSLNWALGFAEPGNAEGEYDDDDNDDGHDVHGHDNDDEDDDGYGGYNDDKERHNLFFQVTNVG